MRRRAQLTFLAFVLVSGLAMPRLSAANLNVESLELVTYGALDPSTGQFPVNSRLNFQLELGGGEKFAGLLRLDFLSTQVESDLSDLKKTLSYDPANPSTWDGVQRTDLLSRINAPGLRLKTVAVTAKRILGLPLEAAYFVGYLDTFCSGDDFVSLFGAAPFATELRGPLRYPTGIKSNPTVSWDGIHAVYGTGLRLSYVLTDRSRVYAYAYQDSDLGDGKGKWSGDARGLFDLGELKVEAFGGASFDSSYSLGLYRGGLLFYVSPGDIGEFYAQVGIPQWNPNEAFSVNDIFFLFEPRVVFEGGSQLALSLFYHPAKYRQKATGEGGSMDVGFNLRFGRLSLSGSQGGIESFLAFRQFDPVLTAEVSPYYEAILSGVAWSFKLGLQLFPLPSIWYGVFKPFIGVKTSF